MSSYTGSYYPLPMIKRWVVHTRCLRLGINYPTPYLDRLVFMDLQKGDDEGPHQRVATGASLALLTAQLLLRSIRRM